jgi:hypothetical protein
MFKNMGMILLRQIADECTSLIWIRYTSSNLDS